ncbi:MAG: hypothetical protein HXY44_09675 [Syntrophaceae bacterium]|nr:hypothetical protein [Syntrophaceae bacterium]
MEKRRRRIGNREGNPEERTTGQRSCFRCGKELRPGGLFYLFQIKVISGFDEILMEPTGEIDQQLHQLLEQVQHCDPKELEREVYEEMTLIVCKGCRDRLVDDLRYSREGPFQIRKDPEPTLH